MITRHLYLGRPISKSHSLPGVPAAPGKIKIVKQTSCLIGSFSFYSSVCSKQWVATISDITLRPLKYSYATRHTELSFVYISVFSSIPICSGGTLVQNVLYNYFFQHCHFNLCLIFRLMDLKRI